MNGRIYDYNVGRFLGVDPFLQFPENSQSANPYSYIMNNPMSGTDPTGYEKEEIEEVNGGVIAEHQNEDEKQTEVNNGQKNERRDTRSARGSVWAGASANVGRGGSSSGPNINQTPLADQSIGAKIGVALVAITQHTREVLTGAVDGAADFISESTGGIVDGDALTEITNIRSGSEVLISASELDLKGVGLAAAGFLVGKAKVVKNLLEKTPFTDADQFRNVRGCKAKCNINTGEIWERDLLHKNQPHFEVYKNKKNYDKGKRDRAVWEDGRPKQEF